MYLVNLNTVKLRLIRQHQHRCRYYLACRIILYPKITVMKLWLTTKIPQIFSLRKWQKIFFSSPHFCDSSSPKSNMDHWLLSNHNHNNMIWWVQPQWMYPISDQPFTLTSQRITDKVFHGLSRRWNIINSVKIINEFDVWEKLPIWKGFHDNLQKKF